ncbi:MAG TPA: hypothetical protein VFY44_00760 [Thermoleophilaceae bacterium]|nr:hypothetical protein [Thermoleophilaceae bacterium]
MKRLLTAFACGVLLATGVAACGDDEKASKTTPTVTTETETAPTTETVPTATTPPPATTPRTTPTPPADPNSGGTTVPRTTPQSQPEDGPDNDLPPEPGSPAERFEQQCQQNPQTCGD